MNLPSGITKIESGVFWGCTKLASITIPENVTKIGNNAFCECSSLVNITIPASVKLIEQRAFEDCAKLTSVTFKNSSAQLYYSSKLPKASGTGYTADDAKYIGKPTNTTDNAKWLRETYCANYLFFKR